MLGSLYLFTLIGLVVKLVSDLLYVVVDPRVQFGRVAQMTAHALSAACRRRSPTRRPRAPAADCRRTSARGRASSAIASAICSLWIFVALLVLSDARRAASATTGRCVARYDGEWFFPIFSNPPETRFGGDFATPTDWNDPFIAEQFAQARQLGAAHAQSALGELARLLPEGAEPGAAERATTGSAPTATAATWWRGCSTAFASASCSRSR